MMFSHPTRVALVAALASLASASSSHAGFTYSTRLVSGQLDAPARGYSFTLNGTSAGQSVDAPNGSIAIATQNAAIEPGNFGGDVNPLLEVTITDTETGMMGFIQIEEQTLGTIVPPPQGIPNALYRVTLTNSARLRAGTSTTLNFGNGRIFSVMSVGFTGGANSFGAPLDGSISGSFAAGFRGSASLNLTFTQTVPEPSSMAMLAAGVAGLGLSAAARGRRARSRAAG